MLTPRRASLAFVSLALLLTACGQPPPPRTDGGDAGPADATPDPLPPARGPPPPPGTAGGAGGPADATPDAPPCVEAVPIHSLHPGPLYLRVGTTAAVRLRLRRDRVQCAADYALSAETAGVI